MKTLWQPEARRELQQRLRRLNATDRGQWGSLTAPQMVSHLISSIGMATGEVPVASRNVFIRYPPLKQLFLYWVPFPKGVRTVPELLGRPPGAWNADVEALSAALDGFAQKELSSRWPPHPAFGPLSAKQWGVLGYRHVDHHLRQFGV
jgi:hypothetical protein